MDSLSLRSVDANRPFHSESRDHYELVKARASCGTIPPSTMPFFFIVPAWILCVLCGIVLLCFQKISSNGALRDQHFNNCNTGLVLSLDGLTLPGTKNRYAMDGAMVSNRTDGSILSRNQCRRIDWGAGRLLVHSKAAAPSAEEHLV